MDESAEYENAERKRERERPAKADRSGIELTETRGEAAEDGGTPRGRRDMRRCERRTLISVFDVNGRRLGRGAIMRLTGVSSTSHQRDGFLSVQSQCSETLDSRPETWREKNPGVRGNGRDDATGVTKHISGI